MGLTQEELTGTRRLNRQQQRGGPRGAQRLFGVSMPNPNGVGRANKIKGDLARRKNHQERTHGGMKLAEERRQAEAKKKK
jgi:hypothetical protein